MVFVGSPRQLHHFGLGDNKTGIINHLNNAAYFGHCIWFNHSQCPMEEEKRKKKFFLNITFVRKGLRYANIHHAL